MKQIGLVLQGGGMRGVYTSGVLDYFIILRMIPTVYCGKMEAIYGNKESKE